MMPAPVKLKGAAERAQQIITTAVSVITPVFGGGVYVEQDENRRQLKEPDKITPLRTASIRGQLRFWWRATQRAQLGSKEDLWAAEAKLWGAASRPGVVSLRVDDSRLRVSPMRVFEMKQGGNGLYRPVALGGMREIAYGAFPLQPKGGVAQRLEPGVLHVLDENATLTLTVPADRAAEVQAALDAWLCFGGIGGRTRRGFGAVMLAGGTDPRALLDRLGQGAAALPGVSSMHGARLRTSTRSFGRAVEALAFGLGVLQKFRQGVSVGRNPPADPAGPKPAGRSRWPEPEAIRALTGQSSRAHRPRFVNVDRFPRAAFGMPIIFHFSDQNGPPRDQEPRDTTLRPQHCHRMASPLILRPYRRVDGKFGCLALVLRDDARQELALVLDEHQVRADLSADEASRIRPLGGSNDPLAAFLDFFAKF